MERPKISLITCTYYRPDLLRRAIQSVQKQTLQDYEHLIISDHCPFAEHVYNDFKEDTRIKFYKTPDPHIYNLGACAFNKGIKEAKSEYISYLLDDDILYPNHLEEHYKQLTSDSNNGWGHTFQDYLTIEDTPNASVKHILAYSMSKLQNDSYPNRGTNNNEARVDVGILCHKKNINGEWVPQCNSIGGWEDTVFINRLENTLGSNEKKGGYTMVKTCWGGIHKTNTKGVDSEYHNSLMKKLVIDENEYSGYKLITATPYVYPELKNTLYGK